MRRVGLFAFVVMLFSVAIIPASGVGGPALAVDLTAPTHPISPYIYGMNFADTTLAAEIGLPVNRWGGNDTSRYDYMLDTSSKGMDWFFSNIPYSGVGSNQPDNSRVNRYIEANRAWGGETIVTMPMIGWMPKAAAYGCSFHRSVYPNQQEFEPYHNCGNGKHPNGTLITGNNPNDASRPIGPEFVTGWMQYLVNRYGTASNGGVKFYNLDNEPMLWNSTHRDVFQQPLSYNGLRDRSYAYAVAIKAVDPSAMTLGPAGFGWTEYFYSALDMAAGGAWWNNPVDRNAHGGTPLAVWYLQQMALYEQTYGLRILDYFDEHFYPQNGVTLRTAGDAAMQALRLRSTRSLWDPTYMDESWISDGNPTAVMLIPRMKAWVAENYPGTKTAISEYNWGGLEHINGALAQADILGIFGREGLDMATLWEAPTANQPGAYSFRMYLNYDGAGGKFGNMSVRASSADQAQVAIYAAVRSSDGALTLMVVNKTAQVRTSSITVNGFDGLPAAKVYNYSAGNLGAIVPLADAMYTDGLSYDFPAESITLIVIAPGTETPVSTELLSHGDFEAELTNWTFINPVGDKRKCNEANPAKVSHTGVCGIKMTANSGVVSRLKTDVAVITGAGGDVVSLSAYAKAGALNAVVQFKAKLTTTAGTQLVKFKLPTGAYPFTLYSANDILLGNLTGGKVQITIKSGTGKVFIDDVSLKVIASSVRGVLPPPDAPEGFRN